MKTLEQIKERISLKENFYSYGHFLQKIKSGSVKGIDIDRMIDKIGKIYAKKVAEDVRRRCAENARTIKTGNSGSWYDASVNKDSILNTEIILP